MLQNCALLVYKSYQYTKGYRLHEGYHQKETIR
jgi:hypothetical protein